MRASADTLAASLVAAGSADSTPDALYLDENRYVDWSIRTDDGTRVLEVGHLDGDVAQLELTVTEMRQFHAQLTATLVAELAREAVAEAARQAETVDTDDDADGI